MFIRNRLRLLAYSFFSLIGINCAPQPEADVAPSSGSNSRYLYVAAGTCYSGGNTTFTATTSSNLVYRLNLSTGAKDMTLADYAASPSQTGDSPVGISNVDSSNVYVLVENGTAGLRRVDKIAKATNGSRTMFTNNTAALSAAMKDLVLLSNGDMLISKTTAIEKISAANVRMTQAGNPYVNAPAAPCATSTTLMSKLGVMANQMIVFLHAAAAQNRFGFVKASGYAAGGDCTPAQSAPNASSFPVAVAYDSTNSKLLVAYAGTTTTTDINSIYAYNITETSTTITVGAANKIYDASLYPATYPYLLYGISDMVLDSTDNKLYIATAVSTATTVVNYAIEKFSYSPSQIGVSNTAVLTRSGNTPFYSYGNDTKCISRMMIAN